MVTLPKPSSKPCYHDTQRTQRVVLRNSLLGADVAKDVQLLLFFSAHALFLSGCFVETSLILSAGRHFRRRAPIQSDTLTTCTRQTTHRRLVQQAGLRHRFCSGYRP